MKILRNAILTILTLGTTEAICFNANAQQQYPQLVATYESPKSTLYRNEATTNQRQSATLYFDRGGNLKMERKGVVISFTSIQIDETLLNKTVTVTCADNQKGKDSSVVGNFSLGQNASFNCPVKKPYSFFWVTN